jgi:hypothetical protein
MNPLKMPGFTAPASLARAGSHQLAERQSPWGPFSGSCGCYPGGLCCCILCYFNVCYWWCSEPSRLPTGY